MEYYANKVVLVLFIIHEFNLKRILPNMTRGKFSDDFTSFGSMGRPITIVKPPSRNEDNQITIFGYFYAYSQDYEQHLWN